MLPAAFLMLVLGALLGLGLGVASILFKVEVDERIEKVTTLLPGYNCGGCGYAGCSGLAEALVNKEVNKVSTCKPSKPEQRQAIIDYLGSTEGPNGEVVKVTL